jgi:uncharacterized membrane protein YheB (UPF0754 family)
MKNLANCSGVEFLTQTNKIRKYVQNWLKETKVLEIRKNKPTLTPIRNDMTPEEKQTITAQNEKLQQEQAMKNISDMLDSCLETHAEQTLKLLGMMCFIEPKDIESVKVTDLLGEFGEIISDEGVIRFFTSLMKLDVMSISG